MSSTLQKADRDKALELARSVYNEEEMKSLMASLNKGTPMPDALRGVVEEGSALDTLAKAMDAGKVVVAAGAPATAKAPAAPVFTLVSATATAEIARVKEVASTGVMRAVAPGTAVSAEDLVLAMPQEIKTLAVDGRSMILGVSPVSLFAEFLAVIAVARETQNPVPLIMAGVFAVTEGYTVASAWAERYASLPKPHPFSKFEISGRTAVKAAEGKKSVNWVSISAMNSSAVHIFGHMIVNAAPEGTFLKTVKDQAGTMFAPPAEDDAKERSKIMREVYKSLTDADKEANRIFAENFSKYVKVVALMFGKGEGDYDKLLAALKKTAVITI
jgi:hypothetical protein